ncbi:hypothetical protein [Bradyrhizobium japonicum]|uniref:hypothetical protein n=1 Tax=Bradyrhizobium japonicum TaxID=375 RepID=UPI001BADC2B5|nr:hypothetical protein [Bradyrhizobium japonicum]MBR0915053.1 hypothetical protein [Bradyrhizobium japonicum]
MKERWRPLIVSLHSSELLLVWSALAFSNPSVSIVITPSSTGIPVVASPSGLVYDADSARFHGMSASCLSTSTEKISDQPLRLQGYDELAHRFVEPTGPKLATAPIERIVYAEKL